MEARAEVKSKAAPTPLIARAISSHSAVGAAPQPREARMSLFVKQVIAELKKVVTPTRKELLSYTGVVLVFVVIMMALVSALDWVFALAVTYVFGTPGG